jgi:hypothetical protein
MDENAEKPGNDKQKFNWVTQRAQCTLPKVFRDLRQQVEEDVKTRNAQRPKNSAYEFLVTENGADFSAVLEAKDARKSVTFSLAEHGILVRDDKGNQILEVTLTFSDQGECKLYVNEAEREMWQVRRMALEDVLF